MDEGGIEPFKSEAVKSALLFFMHFGEYNTKKQRFNRLLQITYYRFWGQG